MESRIAILIANHNHNHKVRLSVMNEKALNVYIPKHQLFKNEASDINFLLTIVELQMQHSYSSQLLLIRMVMYLLFQSLLLTCADDKQLIHSSRGDFFGKMQIRGDLELLKYGLEIGKRHQLASDFPSESSSSHLTNSNPWNKSQEIDQHEDNHFDCPLRLL